MSHDSRSHDLARHFLAGETSFTDDADIDALAQCIQGWIEDWINYELPARHAPPEDNGDAL